MKRITNARSYVGLGLIVFGLGCSDMTAAERESLAARQTQNKYVRATLNRAHYSQGDTVVLSIRNISGQSLNYNFCPTSLEKKDGDEWRDILTPKIGDPPVQIVCPMSLSLLGKGSKTEVTYLLGHDLEDGTYRMAIPTPVPGRGQFTGDYVLNSASFSVSKIVAYTATNNSPSGD